MDINGLGSNPLMFDIFQFDPQYDNAFFAPISRYYSLSKSGRAIKVAERKWDDMTSPAVHFRANDLG